jgi:hypothetical protein
VSDKGEEEKSLEKSKNSFLQIHYKKDPRAF